MIGAYLYFTRIQQLLQYYSTGNNYKAIHIFVMVSVIKL
jgi:hypothetical protein